jgi:hypothetical protein
LKSGPVGEIQQGRYVRYGFHSWRNAFAFPLAGGVYLAEISSVIERLVVSSAAGDCDMFYHKIDKQDL